ncbi:MAG: hypothetical protein JO112_01820, partial [Planctomycetes bacterium]|nr:hypothetical protein [Planctomycetota bacterium]
MATLSIEPLGQPGSNGQEPVLEALAAEEAADRPEVLADEHSVLGLTELLLKNPRRLDVLGRDTNRQAELIPRFLAIALAGFSIFALVLVLILQSAPEATLPEFLRQAWSGHRAWSAVSLWLAYTLGLVAATGVCLPSFYFYGLLAGVKISVLQVATNILKGKAATAVMLMGILPVYVVFVVGLIVFHAEDTTLQGVLFMGLVLPFWAGLWGVQSIYAGFL